MSVSVVIPVFNGARHLAEALASIAGQTRRPDEVLVVDDASTDRSPQIAAAWGATLIRLSSNGGPARARNVAIREAAGDLIAFLDADDRWAPTHLDRVAGLLDRFPGTIVAFGGVQRFGERTGRNEPLLPAATPMRVDPLLLGPNIPQGAAVVRHSALAAVGGYAEDMRYAEDYDLWLRLARLGPFVSTHEPTLHYRFHAGQSSRALTGMFEGAWRARQRALAALERTLEAEERAALRARLLLQWEIDLRAAWHYRGREPLDTVLAQHHRVPDSDAAHRRWTQKARRSRPLWLLGAAIWDRLPAPVRSGLSRRRTARPARTADGPRGGLAAGRHQPA
jgi:glycosyltransferase involved in cell wall biosynthesis